MSVTLSSICTMLDIPDEILVEIILHLNARERAALGNSCKRLNSLVFGDKELLRDLDFSKEGRLTSVTDIAQYFSDENICQHVFKINIRNVICMRGEKMLDNLISKATNLVDVNVHGKIFENIKQLGDFLKPLVNLKRLSIDWPRVRKKDVDTCCDILEKPFSRLTYLSLSISIPVVNFLPTLPLCQQLEELSVQAEGLEDEWRLGITWGLASAILENLKIVQVCGYEAMYLRNDFSSILPDDQEWTEFLLVDFSCDQGFYFEKNVEVCDELQNTKMMEYESIPRPYRMPVEPIRFYLISANLLKEVIRITHMDAPVTYCCLTPDSPRELESRDLQASLLKIDEAKQLLKNPEYQISFLQFNHSIHTECDAHLIASAFPNVTVLVFNEIIKEEDEASNSRTKKHSPRRLRKKGSIAPEQQDDPTNVDSSFKMLVENTPHVKDVTIFPTKIHIIESETWDFDAFHLIALWKNLTTLRLKRIPLKDGNFLIDIGKECPQLETIMLNNLGYSNPCCWTSGLTQMLEHCSNLKYFSLFQCYPYIDDLPEVLTSLCNKVKLTTLRIVFDTKTYNSETMSSSVERVLQQCLKLTTFVFDYKSAWESANSVVNLARIVQELNRPNFQFEEHYYYGSPEVYEDASTSFFSYKWDWLYYP